MYLPRARVGPNDPAMSLFPVGNAHCVHIKIKKNKKKKEKEKKEKKERKRKKNAHGVNHTVVVAICRLSAL